MRAGRFPPLQSWQLLIFAVALLIPLHANAVILFEESFESGSLNRWVGKDGTAASLHGQIVSDPLESDHALTFTSVESAGDIFTADAFESDTGRFVLAFDYLGDPTKGGVPGDLGGYVGYSVGGFNTRNHDWLIGTSPRGGTFRTPADILPDDGRWHRIVFESSRSLGRRYT